jgi:hypothetical protein
MQYLIIIIIIIIIIIQCYEETVLAQAQIATVGDAPIIVLWIVVLIITDILVEVPLFNMKSYDLCGYRCGPLVLRLDFESE